MTKFHLLIAVFAIFLLTGCVEYIDVQNCVTTEPHGFWHGLWHGIIAPIDLIAMIFNDKYAVYATNNNGAWYAFGFLLGSGGWGLLGASRCKRK